jgi:hypothetical protein
MNRLFSNTLTLLTAGILFTACGGGAYVQYHKGPSDSTGYNFVIPRTVVKVEVVHGGGSVTPAASQAAADAKAAAGAKATPDSTPSKPATLLFTPVPVITDKQGANLPILNVTDDSGKFALVSTSITNVTYTDHLIIQSIGTQITDNRKAAIDAVFGIIGMVVSIAGFAEGEATPECPASSSLDTLESFVLTDIHDSTQVSRVPGNPCWGYQVTELKNMGDMSVSSFPLKNDKGDLALPTDTRVPWFPYPSCRNYNISVFPCHPNERSFCKPFGDEKKYSAVVSVADGTSYRRIPLPPKGKVALHTNFCGADVTSETSPLTNNWELVNQVINDVKNLQLKQKKAN